MCRPDQPRRRPGSLAATRHHGGLALVPLCLGDELATRTFLPEKVPMEAYRAETEYLEQLDGVTRGALPALTAPGSGCSRTWITPNTAIPKTAVQLPLDGDAV